MDNDSNPWEDTFKKAEEEYAQTVAAMEAKERIFNNVMETIATDPTGEISYDVSLEYVRQLAKENLGIEETVKEIKTQASEPRAKKQPAGNTKRNNKERSTVAPARAQKRKTQPRQAPTAKSPQKQSKTASDTNKRFARLPRVIAVFGTAAAAVIVIATGLLNRDPKPQATNYESFDPAIVQTIVSSLPEDVRADYKTLAANKYLQLGYLDNEANQDTIQLVINSYSGDVNWDSFYAVNKNSGVIEPISVDKENKIVTLPPSETEIQVEIKDKDGNALECIIAQDLCNPA